VRSSSRPSGAARSNVFTTPNCCTQRNIIEFRRVAACYDKLLATLVGFVKLAAIAIWPNS
jgi:hypothetical protein